MQTTITNKEIINFLKSNYTATSFIDGLKIKYRSIICPFTDLITKVKPGEKVGDIGCGSGQFLLLVSKFAQPSHLYGIEISDRLIQNAVNLFGKTKFPNYGFSVYNGSDFPGDLGSMDIIFLIDVIHHVPSRQLETFLANVYKVMKPGARLVLKDINACSPLVIFNKIHDAVFSGETGSEIRMHQAISILEKIGFNIAETNKRTMYVYPHYTIVANK